MQERPRLEPQRLVQPKEPVQLNSELRAEQDVRAELELSSLIFAPPAPKKAALAKPGDPRLRAN